MATLNFLGGGIFDALIAQAALKTEVAVLLNHFTRLGNAIVHLVQLPE